MMHWLLVLFGFVLGLLAGVGIMSICATAGYTDQAEQINNLRVALGDLVRAVEQGGADEYERATRTAEPLRRARRVL